MCTAHASSVRFSLTPGCGTRRRLVIPLTPSLDSRHTNTGFARRPCVLTATSAGIHDGLTCRRMKRLWAARAKRTPEPGRSRRRVPRQSRTNPRAYGSRAVRVSNTFVQGHENSDKSVAFTRARVSRHHRATHAALVRNPRARPRGPEQYTLVQSSHQPKTYLSQQQRHRPPAGVRSPALPRPPLPTL
jgi:hypothetical protein